MTSESFPNAARLQAIRDGLFFIVGPHRAGTTLLQAMLSSHSALTIPPETGFFDQVWPRRESLGSLTVAENLPRVGRFLNGRDCSVSDLAIDWQKVTQALTITRGTYDDLFAVLISLYADQRGKRRAGEKSPRHLFAASELVSLYPNAKFLCLIRDPRAVVRSERATSWGSRSVCRIMRRWCRAVDEAVRLQQIWPPDRIRLVRYEDLVGNPERELRAICDFLGEAFEPQMLKYYDRAEGERGFRPDEVWKQNTLQAIDAGRSTQWQRELSAAHVQMIEQFAGDRLSRHAYPATDTRVSSAALLTAWLSDHCRWGLELCHGVLKGRRRRRPWSQVWREMLALHKPRD